jgi:hypothetical protein
MGSYPGRSNSFYLLRNLQTVSGLHPASYSMVVEELRRSGCEVHYTFPSCGEIKNGCCFTSAAPVHIHIWDREKFNFLCVTNIKFPEYEVST